ncbi:MAG: isoamylase early set domain-containing protein [Gemmatimonadaceae bacterium]
MSDQVESLEPDLQRIVDEARRPVALAAGARERLLEAIRAEPAPQRRAALAWMLEPRRFALPPLASAALAAGLVGIGVISGLLIHRDGPSAEQRAAVVAGAPQLPDSLAPRAVKFVLIAPMAARVSVVGDFNGWDASATPMQTLGTDGTWTVFVPLHPGLHTYQFVIDGSSFVTDPSAPLAPDDGYGSNSVLFVKGSSL